MALTDKQKATITTTLNAKAKNHLCPVCQQNNWGLGDELAGCNATSIGGGLAMGGPHIPMVQMYCNNCGYIRFHAVGALGISLQ